MSASLPPPVRDARPSISAADFDRFLARLDPDREKAADRYEQIRHKLVILFSVREVSFPEDQADVALDRICRRVAEGELIDDLPAYVLGVARLVELEWWRWSRRQLRLSRLMRVAAVNGELSDRPLRCVETCLANLTVEERELLLRYYGGEGRLRIESRRRMAEALRVSLDALRVRVFRLRWRLERCVRARVAKTDDGAAAGSK
jgi:DNA-directed RNA polymerase specialized sigma24 family protein